MGMKDETDNININSRRTCKTIPKQKAQGRYSLETGISSPIGELE